jgi:hypothetical protein
MTNHAECSTDCPAALPRRAARIAAGEIALIFLLCFLYAGWPPPDVNESHYLVKAKHYWQPAWCARDHFLASRDAHTVFYWTFGWLTLFLPLTSVAWIGRVVTWFLLAWSWRRLSTAVIAKPWMSVLSAGLFITLLQHCQMAGEWVVGGVEAKGFAYVLVLLALSSMLRGQWRAVWPMLGAACSFHVLVGGWSFLAAFCGWYACRHLRPRLTELWPTIALGTALALPGLLPALALNRGIDRDVIREANRIYVYERLDHHLVIHRFPRGQIVRQALLLTFWVGVCMLTPCPLPRGALGQRPLRGFVGGAVLIALIGIAIDQSMLQHLDSAAGWLRFYWYRLSDAMLPLGAAIAWISLLASGTTTHPARSRGLLAATIVLVSTNLMWTNLARRGDLRSGADRQTLPASPTDAALTREIYRDWLAACAWIAGNTDPQAIFLTPRMQQTFKWRAARAEVSCWKDVPQDAAALVEWWRRQSELYPRPVIAHGLAAHGTPRLLELARQYDADYVLIDRAAGRQAVDLPRVFPVASDEANRFYEVYAVPQATIEPQEEP